MRGEKRGIVVEVFLEKEDAVGRVDGDGVVLLEMVAQQHLGAEENGVEMVGHPIGAKRA